MPVFTDVCAGESPLLFRTHHIDHLTADGACLAGGEIAVVALLEVHTDLVCCLHLESFKSLSSLRSSHTFHFYLPFCLPGSSAVYAASASERFGLAVILYLAVLKISVEIYTALLLQINTFFDFDRPFYSLTISDLQYHYRLGRTPPEEEPLRSCFFISAILLWKYGLLFGEGEG